MGKMYKVQGSLVTDSGVCRLSNLWFSNASSLSSSTSQELEHVVDWSPFPGNKIMYCDTTYQVRMYFLKE